MAGSHELNARSPHEPAPDSSGFTQEKRRARLAPERPRRRLRAASPEQEDPPCPPAGQRRSGRGHLGEHAADACSAVGVLLGDNPDARPCAASPPACDVPEGASQSPARWEPQLRAGTSLAGKGSRDLAVTRACPPWGRDGDVRLSAVGLTDGRFVASLTQPVRWGHFPAGSEGTWHF